MGGSSCPLCLELALVTWCLGGQSFFTVLDQHRTAMNVAAEMSYIYCYTHSFDLDTSKDLLPALP